MAYLDDVNIFSKSAEQHLKHIQIVLTRLKQAKLRLKKCKCLFFKQELHYLGYLLTTNGIKLQPEKIKAISEMKPPKNQKGVRVFGDGQLLLEIYKSICQCCQTHDKADKERCQMQMNRGVSNRIRLFKDMSY